MRAIQAGNTFNIFDDSIEIYEELPARTYSVEYSDMKGCYLSLHSDLEVNEKIYGVHEQKAEKALTTFGILDRGLGIILSGDKGMGKSVFARLLCKKAIGKGIPVIIVSECVPGIANFIESINQECVVLFDEFDKTFDTCRGQDERDEQAQLLSLFDGVATGKRLYIVTCNEIYNLNDYLINRPGRFHYHFRFDYPEVSEIEEYLRDKLQPEYYSQIKDVVAFSSKVNLNYDCLRSIAFELNLGNSFAETINDLNILNTSKKSFDVTLYYENGRMLHRYSCSMNLFMNEGDDLWITMYGEKGLRIAEVKVDRTKIEYDVANNASVVKANGLYIDYVDPDDEPDVNTYKNLKPSYMTIEKNGMRNLRYTV
ncbi:ATPase family associated with various cellular activities (AAA) [Pseudobutyrivibrio sp. JW11]|uniref:AAA family ATPase n=1 Tax=Pseudobutyrivibrio sp. JW11 TaxID=1855302 RepID=UPI0008E95B9C|nr:AAA family ATPase [Pseudobutyrivibrio sp. JW11]SFO17512.1 ATPase family associated with various cellular activities (AAA) [Pseudobutyrivibrio sp. JW11]